MFMLTEVALSGVFELVNGLLSLLPDLEWTMDTTILVTVVQFLQVIFYIVPVGTVVQILFIQLTLQTFRITVSLIKTIWQLIPVL